MRLPNKACGRGKPRYSRAASNIPDRPPCVCNPRISISRGNPEIGTVDDTHQKHRVRNISNSSQRFFVRADIIKSGSINRVLS